MFFAEKYTQIDNALVRLAIFNYRSGTIKNIRIVRYAITARMSLVNRKKILYGIYQKDIRFTAFFNSTENLPNIDNYK